MNQHDEYRTYSVHLRDEHQRLGTQLDQVRDMFRETVLRGRYDRHAVSALVQRLLALRDELAEHFRQEEIGGYLEEIIARAPTLSAAVRLVERQHVQMLQELGRVIHGTQRADPLALARLKEQFDRFAMRLAAHEQMEDRLLQQAFQVDE